MLGWLCTVAVSAQIQPVVISEVFYDTPLDEHWFAHHHGGCPCFNGEFVELFNPTTQTIDLSGWSLKDEDGSNRFVFPAGSTIAARSTVLVAYRHPLSPTFSIRELFPSITAEQESTSVHYHATIKLTNDGDALTLQTDRGDVVDQVSWRSQRKNHNPKVADNWTLQAYNGDQYVADMVLHSLQRKSIHASLSRIDFLQEDFETAEATPLHIPPQYDLAVLSAFYRGDEPNTDLPVGALPGEAVVTPTGAATYRIPIEAPPGTNGWQPQLAIAYNSQGGIGTLGRGWDVAGLSAISRGTPSFYYDGDVLETTSVQFDERDQLYMDGQRLLLLQGQHWADGAVYGLEAENRVRVTLSKAGDGQVRFTATYPGGRTVEYGGTDDSRVTNAARADDSRVLAWKANKATDAHGNEIRYTYDANGTYLKEVTYAKGENKLQFHYVDAGINTRTRYTKDFLTKQHLLLSYVDVYAGETRVRSYQCDYVTSDMDRRLNAVTELAGGAKLNATFIGWGEDGDLLKVDLGVRADRTLAEAEASIHAGDVNGDGYSDLIEMWVGSKNGDGHFCARLYDPSAHTFRQDAAFVKCFPYNNEDSKYTNKLTTGDINGDGKSEIIFMNRGVLEVYSYDGGALRKISERDMNFMGFDKRRGYDMAVAGINHDNYNDVVVLGYHLSERKLLGGIEHLFFPEVHILYGTESGLDTSKPISSVETRVSSRVFAMGNFRCDGKVNFLLNGFTGEYGLINEASFFSILNANWKLKNRRNVIPADFNGDGITDILFQNGQNYWWGIKQGTTDYTHPDFVELKGVLHRVSNGSESDKERDACYVADYNGDGLPDIILGDETWTGKGKKATFSHTTWYFY